MFFFFSNNPYILTNIVLFFLEGSSFFLFFFQNKVDKFRFLFWSFFASSVFFQNWISFEKHLCFSFIKCFFHSSFISSLIFLISFFLNSFFLTFTFLSFFFEQPFSFLFPTNSSNYPFYMHALPLCVLPFVQPLVHLLSLFAILVFSFLPHVLSFSFFCFLSVWPLSKTRIWKLLRFWSFNVFVSFSFYKGLHVFACLPFSFFFCKKKVSFF